jgi:hypothetical protein
MRSYRVIAPIAFAVALAGLAVVPRVAATSSRAKPIVAERGPVASASGNSAAPVIPSLVNVRIVRVQAALKRAVQAVDRGLPANATVELASVRSNMTQAWTAAQYLIKNAPPPPPASSGSVIADASGAGASGVTYASPEDTAFAVLNLQHEVITTGLGLVDYTNAALVTNVSTTISAARQARDSAIAYIHSLPAPPTAGSGSVRAGASGAPVGSTWGTIMPNAVPLLDDEIQQASGSSAPLAPNFLPSLITQLKKTQTTINTYWPPVPAG